MINVEGPHSYGNDVPSIFTSYKATTGPDGRFGFERVFPGKGHIGRNILLTGDDGATEVTSSCMVPANFPAGETTLMLLGGIGRPVVGKLRVPEGFDGKVLWNFALIHVQPPERGAHATSPYFTVSVDRDGSFRIDDVPAGEYSLGVRFDRGAPGHLQNYRFTVPRAEGRDPSVPVDLGVLTLQR
jgi:hypothetical protein